MSLSANFPTTRPSLLLDFVNSGQMDPRITFSRASGATWFNSAGTLIGVDASSSSLTVGTGQQTLTLAATAGVDRGWIVGTSVLLSASTVTNTMTGVVVSYTASTQVLVVNVASVVGSGTYSTWQVSNLMPRFDYNPSTLAAQGLLIEEARTNGIRNNTMVGAVAGTPGTLPTNWSDFTALTGLTRQIVGTGTESGITYIDVRLSGTPSAAGRYYFFYDTSTAVAALNGQTWTTSGYFKLQAGTLTGVTAANVYFQENNSGGTYLTEQNIAITNPTSAGLSTQRASATRTNNQATTAFLMSGFNVLLSGAAIDVTLRIGLPQLEQGAFATSVIPTTTTALTRAADVASVNTLSPWYNAAEGTLYAQGILVGGTAATFPRQAALVGSNANDDSIDVSWNAPSGVMVGNVRTGGVSQMSQGSNPTKSAGSTFKAAVAYKTNDANNASDGNVGTTDTTVTLPTVQSLRIGGQAVFQPTASSWIQRITYYPTRLSNAQLQAITA